MNNLRTLSDLSVPEIRKALSIKERIATLESQLESVLDDRTETGVTHKRNGFRASSQQARRRVPPAKAKRKIGRLRKPKTTAIRSILVEPPADVAARWDLPSGLRLYRIDAKTQARLDLLLDRNREGTITSGEHSELSKMVEELDELSLQNAQILADAATTGAVSP
jgi:hypothetical protein